MKTKTLLSIAFALAIFQGWANNDDTLTAQCAMPGAGSYSNDDFEVEIISGEFDQEDGEMLRGYSRYSEYTITQADGHSNYGRIYSDPSSLTFPSTNVGKCSTKEITVHTMYINDYLKLSLEGTNKKMFCVETSILGNYETDWGIEQDRPGAKVKVYYVPTKKGTHTAKLVIKEHYWFMPKKCTVTLKGTAVTRGGAGSNSLNDKDVELTITDIVTEVETGGLSGGETGVVIDDGSNDELQRVPGNGAMMAPSNSYNGLNELSTDVKIFAEGHDIIIESAVEQSAIISDIAGRAQQISLQVGRNVIPMNSNGMYIVRIGEKSAKLMLK